MFFHNLKYNILYSLRSKESMFSTLVFPIALSFFMYMAFGNIYESTEKLNPVPVAIVEKGENEAFTEVLEEVSKEGDDKLLDSRVLSEKDAKKELTDEKINGIIYVDSTVSLEVNGNGIEETVLSTFLNQYIRTEATIEKIAETNPMALEAAVKRLTGDTLNYEEIKLSDGNYDNLVNYFYAIFAMSCLFSSFVGISGTLRLQANLSTLGQRRSVAPTGKIGLVLSQFISSLIVQFAVQCIAFCFMKFVLGVNFGDKYPAILLLLLIGSAIGLSLGMFIGSLPKPVSEGAKMGIGTAISMILSVMADLCANGVKNLIEHTAPIVNRINPAALITDSFYSLNTFDSYERYCRNIITLVVMSAVFLSLTIIMMRRNRYASI